MSNPSLPQFTWDDFCHLLDSPSRDPVAVTPATELPSWPTFSGQYFFEMHSQKRPLEVLCIKLSLSSVLCSFVADEHERQGRSRGVIGPEQVLVHVSPLTTILPTRWTAVLSLTPGEQVRPAVFDEMPVEMAGGLCAIPSEFNALYAAPLVREWPFGKKILVTALIQSADLIPDDAQTHLRGLVRIHVIADGLNAGDFSDRDVFRVTLPISNHRGANVEVWARKVGSPERGIIVSGVTDAVLPDSWKAFVRAVGEVRSAAEIAVYRAFAPEHDLYSCSMLLVRALLGSDERRWSQVAELVPSIVDDIAPVVQGVAEDDDYTIHVRVRDRLRESAGCFEAREIPETLWWDAWVVVLRACSRIRGFRYEREPAQYQSSPARSAAQALASLARRARVELFDAGERDAMILRVCDRAMDHLGAGV